MTRRSQPNQTPNQPAVDWGSYMPPTAVGQSVDSVRGSYDQAPANYSGGQQPLAITAEALAKLEQLDKQSVQAASVQREALVRQRQEQLREAQQLNSRPMFGARGGELPAYPRNNLQLPPGLADRQSTLPPSSYGRRPELPPAPSAPRALGRAPHDPKAKNNQKPPTPKKTDNSGSKIASSKEWFIGLPPARRVLVGVAAGALVVSGVVGLDKLPDSAGNTTAQLARANQDYPVFKNDSLSCGAALAKVAFAGSMTLELKVSLKEPGHTAYLPVAAYMGTDLDVGVCGQPGKDGNAQVVAAYTDKKYTVDRAVLNLNAPGSSFAPQNCPPGSNDVKRICINNPKGFFVDGKKATIATTETLKGSGLYKVTTEDKKEFTVTAAELGRINNLTLAPAAGAAPSKEYSQYLTSIATNMKHAALIALENPEICAPLQSTIDTAVSKEITARNKTMNFKQPKNATDFKKDSKYAPMSTSFMKDKANMAILEPNNGANIINVNNFKPTCSVKSIEGSPPASATPTPTPAAKTPNK